MVVSNTTLTGEEARQQAEAEGLTLLKANNKVGYFCVQLAHPGTPKPYQARVKRSGKKVSLGTFATAEEAALCVARSRRPKELLGRWEQVLNAVGARSAQEVAAEEDVLMVEVEVVEAEEAEEAEDVQVEVVEVVGVVEHEGVDDEGGRSEGRPKRRRSM